MLGRAQSLSPATDIGSARRTAPGTSKGRTNARHRRRPTDNGRLINSTIHGLRRRRPRSHGDAQAPNGQPITAEAKPSAEKNRYGFSFALKPGDTKFQVSYHLPYSGQASLSQRLTRDFEHFVVVTPVGMTFTSGAGSEVSNR